MNFAQMLASPVTPLTDYEPACQKRQRQVSQASHARDAKAKNQHANTVAMYRYVWGDDEWLATAEIERRLGYSPSSCIMTMRRWERQGIVEARPVVGANGRHKRSMGIEWRWR